MGFEMIYVAAFLILAPSLVLAFALCRMAARFGNAEPGQAVSKRSTVVSFPDTTIEHRDRAA